MASAEIPIFGEALAIFRTRARLSQQQLAKQLGKNRRSVAAWEAGDYLPKTKGDVLELARILALNDEEATILLKAAGIDPHLPIWNIPFPQNPFFTGRDQELEQLHAQLHHRQTAVVGQAQSISGLGGIGKTQLAVEYAYRHHGEYQYVLWARAESVEALTASFTEIAHLLTLHEKDAQEQAITIQAVKRWLQRQHGWLLILDNADNSALLPHFLPPTVGGHLLITTRAAEMNTHLAGLAHSLVLETFSDEQGALFLLHRSNLLTLGTVLYQVEEHTRQLALEITHELGGLPLALDQAGAYLKATGSSLATYQQLYRQHRAQLLAQRRGYDHPEPVATTWDISFHEVEQQNSAAANLLRLCAFLAPDAIPEEIVTESTEKLGLIFAPVVADAYFLNQAVEALRSYSLIVRNPRLQTLSIHRLVQVVLRDSMTAETRKQWAEWTIQIVQAGHPNEKDIEEWDACELWLPHMLNCADWIEQEQMTTPEAVHLLNEAGYYLDARARYREAEPLFKRALKICEEQLSVDPTNMITSLSNLGILYHKRGRYTDAESLFKQALKICEQQWGTEHPETARSVNNLALLYRDQGKYDQAESLLKRTLEIRERQWGVEHPETAGSLGNLGAFYRMQGKYDQAESLLKRASEICERQWGVEHPETATSINNLANVYFDMQKYAEAEPLFKRTLSIRERKLGLRHPETADSLNNLAALYSKQNKKNIEKQSYGGSKLYKSMKSN